MDDIKNKFDEYQEDYIDLHDFFAGERQVKEKGTRYTPMLEGQEKSKNSSAMYDKYKSFGILYNALARTRQGLKGAILRKPIDIQFPDRQKDLLNKIMLNGASFNDLTREITDAVLGYGRIGALVDMRNEIPYVSLYNALSIIEWPEIIIEGVEQRIILSEMVEVIDPKDPSKMKIVEQRRYLELDEHGEYIVTVKQKTDETNDLWVAVLSTPENPNPVMPSYKGKRLTTIPFSFIGSSNNTPTPSRPPLLDLLNLLKGHWKLTVAYQYGLNFAGLPTPCFAGFNFDADAEIPLGPGAVHHTPEPGAKSWFMSTGGIGLVEMAAGLDRLEKQMAVVGARLLEEQRPGVESAETVRLRGSGDSATLADIAGNVENGLTDILKDIGFWVGVAESECQVTVNKDFLSTRLGPLDITALLGAVQAGEMSSDTFLWNLQQGEILQPGKTVKEEQEAIAEDTAKNQKNNIALQGLGGSV